MTPDLTPDQYRRLGRIEAILEDGDLPVDTVIAHLGSVEPGYVGPDRADGTTVATLIDLAIAALEPGTVSTYGSYWRVLRDGLALPVDWEPDRLDRWLADLRRHSREKGYDLTVPDAGDLPHATVMVKRDGTLVPQEVLVVTPGHADLSPHQVRESHVRIQAKWVRVNALARLDDDNRRRRARGMPDKPGHGRGAVENFVSAIRSLYTFAAAEGVVPPGYSPAGGVSKPGRQKTVVRRSMDQSELDDIWATCTTTGYDPELDQALFEFFADTGGRDEAAVNLKLRHLVREGRFKGRIHHDFILLDQKGDKPTAVPVRRTLIDSLEAFARSRGASEPEDAVFRFRGHHPKTGEPFWPMTARRIQNLHKRVQQQHAWAGEQGWTVHWFRHHLAERVEKLAGRDAKRILLGHEPDGVSDIYGPSDFVHVAWALSQLSGEPHPDAVPPRSGLA